MNDTERKIASILLDLGAVFLRPQQPFTWASGIQSPIYCDNRLILGVPAYRQQVEDALAESIREHYPSVQAIMGTATAGIAHAALVAERLELPMGYVRASSKDHGRNNKIEGQQPAGLQVVVVEDLISTGGSSLAVVEALREASAQVLGLLSIFTYGMAKSAHSFAEAQLPYHSLCQIDTLLEVAVEQGYISEKERTAILRFREQPADPSWKECL